MLRLILPQSFCWPCDGRVAHVHTHACWKRCLQHCGMQRPIHGFIPSLTPSEANASAAQLEFCGHFGAAHHALCAKVNNIHTPIMILCGHKHRRATFFGHAASFRLRRKLSLTVMIKVSQSQYNERMDKLTERNKHKNILGGGLLDLHTKPSVIHQLGVCLLQCTGSK